MSLNGIFMALPGYHHILQGYYEGNFICFTQKSFGDILKKCIMQQFKKAKIFCSSFLDFSPAWAKTVCGGRCRRQRRELEITLPPFLLFALFSHRSPTFKINVRMEGEDAAVEEHSLPGFSVQRSDFHEHEQETSPWSCFQAWIINGCISSPLIASSSGDVFFSPTSVNTRSVRIK